MACYSNEQVQEAKELYEKITADSTLMSLIISEQMREMDEIERKKAMKRAVEQAEALGEVRGEKRGETKGEKKQKVKLQEKC